MQPWQATLNNFTLNNNKTAPHWTKSCGFWREIKPYLLSLSITSSSHCMSLSMIWFTWWYLCNSWPHDWEQSKLLWQASAIIRPDEIWDTSCLPSAGTTVWWNMCLLSVRHEHIQISHSTITFNVFCKTII